MSRWRVWAVVAIIVLAVAGVLVLRNRSDTTETTSFTEVLTVERGDLVADIAPTGEVSAERQAQLSFDVTKIPLVELCVRPGQWVEEGEVLARIDPASLERAVDQAEADLLSAEEALRDAEEPYTELDRQKAELGVAQAEAALEEALLATDDTVRQAEFDLESAQLNLTITHHGSTVGKTVRDLEYAVAWHERKLQSLEAQRQRGTAEQNAADQQLETLADGSAQLAAARSTAQASLSAAEDRLTKAEEALSELLAGPDALAQAQDRNRVLQAEYNLAKVREDLATILAGPDAKTLQLAQSRYDAAKATLEEAQVALDAATMVAPFDATVISVGAEVGDLVSSNTNVVTLADLTDMQVLAFVDETDISQVEVGQEAEITFDAFPGKLFSGKVLEVPLEGDLVQNIVSYEVLVSLEGTEGVSLRSGMTANLSIVVGRRENVLLVPALAVWQAEEGNVVMVQDSPGGAATATGVEVGLSDGLYVEVLRGLNEGDRVVVEYQSSDDEFARFGGVGVMIGGSQRGMMRP